MYKFGKCLLLEFILPLKRYTNNSVLVHILPQTGREELQNWPNSQQWDKWQKAAYAQEEELSFQMKQIPLAYMNVSSQNNVQYIWFYAPDFHGSFHTNSWNY